MDALFSSVSYWLIAGRSHTGPLPPEATWHPLFLLCHLANGSHTAYGTCEVAVTGLLLSPETSAHGSVA